MASRRPSTRAAASGSTGDENKINPAARSTKNAGLALRSKNTNVATSAVSSLKGGKPDISTATAASRRRALADSSNNKAPQHAAGGKGSKNAAEKDHRLVVLVEDDLPAHKKTSAAAAGRPALNRRSTRSSLTKSKTEDDDDIMDVVEAEQSRPIKSMRASTSAAGTSKPPSSRNNAALAGKPTNIPRRSSTTTIASTKNAGLKRSLKSSSVAPSVVPEPEISIELKKSTKNAGLRLKREIQALESDGESGNANSSGRKSSFSTGDENETKSERAARNERRRSKRLRHDDPDENNVVNAPSTSANFQSTTSDLDVEQAPGNKGASRSATARSYVDVPDEDDVESVQDEEDDDDLYEEAKDAGWEDLDIGDEEDPLMVTEYVVEIHDYMKELELQTRPDPHYMDRQSEVNWKMRSILVDWLIEVHGKFRLLPETIFLAVNIMDRLLSIRTVSLVKFQLVGIVSLQLASKYEEVVCPSVSSFLYMTDGCYTEEELLAAERYVLKQIDFNLSYPNPINFLRRISKADNYDIQTRTVAKYFIEMSCVERKFLDYTPSLIAAAGMWLARKILDRGYWNANLIHYSTYSQLELLPCAQLMLDYILRRSQAPGEPIEHPHFSKKYSAKKFYRAAEIVKQWAERRYLVKKPGTAGGTYGAVTTLFTGLEGGGRLEEWEEEGEEIPEVDYE